MAKEVFVNQKDIMELAGSHLPVFDHKNQLPDDWKPLLNFKKHLELDDYLKILDSIAKAAEENRLIKPNISLYFLLAIEVIIFCDLEDPVK